MKIKRFFMGMITLMLVAFGGLYLVSCGDDDDIDKKEHVNNDDKNDGDKNDGDKNDGDKNDDDNNNGDKNDDEKNDVPQELLGAWIYVLEKNICVFNADGTGTKYYLVDTTDNTAHHLNNFTYTYNHKNSSLTFNYIDGGTDEFALAFQDDKTMTLTEMFDGIPSKYYSYTYSRYDGPLPTVDATPSTPTGVTATVDGSSISVSWQSVNGASSYKIYRSSSADGSYSFIGTASSTSYRDNSPVSGYNYYKVSAVNNNGESQQSSYASCYFTDDGGGGNSVPSTPTGLSAVVDGSSIAVSWQAARGAERYRLYRSSSAEGSYSEIAVTDLTSCRDNSPISGYNYYRVSAENDKGKSQQSSYASCYFTGGGGSSTAPNAPTGVTVSNEGNNYIPSIRISWSSVSNATSYKVYRSSSANGSYSQIGSPTTNTYMYDDNPMSGNNYYKVKAVNSSGESPYSSYAVYNNNPEYSPCPPTVKVSGTTSQTVTWTNSTSTGCGKPTSYEVYKRNPNTGSYELKKTTSSTSYSPLSSDIHPGKNMYGIKAINNSGSDTGTAYSQDVPLAKPSSFSAQKLGSDQIKFTWSKVTWASGYQIFMSTSASGSYYIATEVDDGSKTSFTYYYPASSGTYYFKIKAYCELYWGGRIYSDLTTYKSVKF